MKRYHRAAVLLAGLMMTSVAAAQNEDFYEERLRLGQEAYRAQRFREATHYLRVAAFGFLERPTLLSESLARLALAQAASGQRTELEATLSRFLDVERRFGAYAETKLEAGVGAEFRSLLPQRVPRATLLSLPGLAGLVESEEQRIARAPLRGRRKALEAAHRREPGNVAWPLGLAREATQRQDHKEVIRWADKALELDGENAEARALRLHARAARRECAQALSDLKALPRAELDKRPELRADSFVCLVKSGDWSAAEGTLPLIPAQLAARGDVVRARQKLDAERARRNGRNPVGSGRVSELASEASGLPQTAASAPSRMGSASRAEGGATQSRMAAANRQGTSGESEALAETSRLMKEGRAREAERILREALGSEPRNRPLQLALLEVLCLSRNWQSGAAQLSRVSPFSEEEVVPMFYAAVVLYETGRTEEARSYMERALPRISGPFVDEYARKILGRL